LDEAKRGPIVKFLKEFKKIATLFSLWGRREERGEKK